MFKRLFSGSRMTRECHVRFCEKLSGFARGFTHQKYCIAGVLSVGCLSAATLLAPLLSLTGCSRQETAHETEEVFDFSTFLQSIDNVIDMAVIGSGPAGLTACVYGCRGGRHVVCFEGAEPGGLLTKTAYVENWPGEKAILGADIVGHIHDQAADLGALFVPDIIERIDFSTYPYRLETEEGLVVHAFSVIITTGATPKKLGIPGEEQYWGQGVTTCAICDAPFYKGKDVVVVGGGDSAVEEAIQLTPHARSITIMVRGEAMRAAARMQAHLKEYPTITVRYNVSIQEILGNGVTVTGIVVRDNLTGATAPEPIDGVFLAIGHEPNVWMLEDQVALTKTGHIALMGRTQKTSVPGVFAAGDVADADYRQAGVAAGDGIKAALEADRFLAAQGYSQAVAREFDGVRFYPAIKGGISLVESLSDIATLEKNILAPGSGLTIVDFYAHTCPSCMHMLPVLERVAYRYADAVSLYAADFETVPDLAALLGVKKVPTLLVFNNGKLVETVLQPLTYAELAALIELHMAT
jgi:thioredoxin reductase (NADPH)